MKVTRVNKSVLQCQLALEFFKWRRRAETFLQSAMICLNINVILNTFS